MNLTKLFEVQNVLRDRIGYNEPDRFEKLVLALNVELGELANELPEVFKFWSEKRNNYERALEEYVDGLHFVLELGLEFDAPNQWGTEFDEIFCGDEPDILERFIYLKKIALLVRGISNIIDWAELFVEYVMLGQMLGFTWEQVERAYYEKNKVNHERQNNGY